MRYTNLLVEWEGKVATATLNRPEILNPLDIETLQELGEFFAEVAASSEVEIVLLRGSGRAFSAGGDLKKHIAIHQDVHVMQRMNRISGKVMRQMEELDQIVIAVVDGLCVAGGLEVTLCCDYVIASERASFSDGHMNVALLPGSGGTQRLPRLIGPLKAKDLMLTARFVSGREAESMGLVTYCVPDVELESTVNDLVSTLSAKSFAGRAAIKYLVNQGMKGTLESGLRLEKPYVEHFESTHPDAHEGLLAFNEKRPPQFGRYDSDLSHREGRVPPSGTPTSGPGR